MFSTLLDWIIRNDHEYDEDGPIDDGFDYDPNSYWWSIAVRGGKYIEFDCLSHIIECENLTIEDQHRILTTPLHAIHILPPDFPESLAVFSDYEFEHFSCNNREDIQDYAFTYINCRAKVRRKLLAHRIQDLTKRCSSYDQSILRIILFHLPHLDINYHHPMEE